MKQKKFLDKFPCIFCEEDRKSVVIFQKDHSYTLSPITDCLTFTNFKTRGNLKFVSTFIFDIILFSETCYQTYSANMKEHNFKKEIIVKVQRHFISKIRNLKPEHPIIDTFSLESLEMKIIKFISSYYCTLRVYTQCKQLTQKNHSPKSSLDIN